MSAAFAKWLPGMESAKYWPFLFDFLFGVHIAFGDVRHFAINIFGCVMVADEKERDCGVSRWFYFTRCIAKFGSN
jgi:hypothetical protein